jgi:hypothetical protein
VLIVLLFFTSRYFIQSLEESYSQGELHPIYHPRRQPTGLPLQDRQLTISDIQPWMTFDYVNVVFKLPTSYFKNLLGISDPRYPNIRIDSYSRESNFNEALLLQTIKKYITTYKSS